MTWYAIQREKTDSWDYGSFDFDRAKEKLLEQGEGLIAVIEIWEHEDGHQTDCCIEEITFEEVANEQN